MIQKSISDKVILVGGFLETIELCEKCGKKIVGIIDNNHQGEYYSYSILGTDNDAFDIFNDFADVPIVITPDKPQLRKKLAEYYQKIGFAFCNLIHPGASISDYTKIGKGVLIQNGVNISANVTIGDFVKVNSCANITHDCDIERYSTIAPNSVLLGRVKILESCYIGSNSVILPDITIFSRAIIGAGAVVTKNVEAETTVVGNPAKQLHER